MTVVASPADVPPQGYSTGLGKGAALLAEIAAIQAMVTAAANPRTAPALAARLNMLQMEAVDYFMGSYWVSADSILTTMTASMILPKAGDRHVTAALADIAARAAQVVILLAAGTPIVNPLQYSRAYPPSNSGYPLTGPDVYLYGLQTQLVDYCMLKAILPAALILSTMTGAQTYPWNGYTSTYTWYQIDGG